MLKRLLPVRLIFTLALAVGGMMATRQAAARGLLPPAVAQAVEIIQDRQVALMAAFGWVGAMGFIPLRWIFRSRYAALFWAAGICMTAYDVAGGGTASVDAANSADSNAAQVSALLAEDAG